MDNRKVARELVKIARSLVAIEFPSQDALDKYLKEHPKADRGNHSVKKMISLKKGELHGGKLTDFGARMFGSGMPVAISRTFSLLDKGKPVSMTDIGNAHEYLSHTKLRDPKDQRHAVLVRKKLKAILDSNR